MSAEKAYRDSDGRECDLPTMRRREPAWACNRILQLAAERDAHRIAKLENDERFTRERDDARDALRNLIRAMDAQRDASVTGEGRAEADAAFARALAAARGVL